MKVFFLMKFGFRAVIEMYLRYFFLFVMISSEVQTQRPWWPVLAVTAQRCWEMSEDKSRVELK